MPIDKERLRGIIVGTDHDSLEDAVAADLVSAIPIVGAISDFFRVVESESKPQKVLQTLDLISEPVPLINVITPTNTIMYLEKNGMLPFKFEDGISGILPMLKKRRVK